VLKTIVLAAAGIGLENNFLLCNNEAMANSTQNEEFFTYYDERASEYEAFYYGLFPTGQRRPDLYLNDRMGIASIYPSLVSGRCLDIACGTGFWLPVYHRNCSHITLIDQSEKMLAECCKKIDLAGIKDKTTLICHDIFSYKFPKARFDCANAGFIISHFNDEEMAAFLSVLKNALVYHGVFVITDSVWSDFYRSIGMKKDGMAQRSLFDGRQFQIYKYFFEKEEMQNLGRRFGFEVEIKFWGEVFFLALCKFR
jgi:SAM-dependent methyltransferase